MSSRVNSDPPPSRAALSRRSGADLANALGPQRLELLRVACSPGSSITEELHAFVVAFTKLRYRPAVADRIALTAYELFANGLSYGSISSMVALELAEEQGFVLVTVTNEAIQARIKVLVERCALLRTDAKSIYMEEIRRNVTGGIPRAMLGLARIVHEAGVELSVVAQGAAVTVVGRCKS